MKAPSARFLVVPALVLVVPLGTFLLFLGPKLGPPESLLGFVVTYVLATLAIFGWFLMFVPAMVDAALFGGIFFEDGMLGSTPRDMYGWAFYLLFYFIVAILAGFLVARLAGFFPRSRRPPRHLSAAGAAADSSRSLRVPAVVSEARSSATLPQRGRSLFGGPARKFVVLICVLAVMWFLPPFRRSPTVGKNDTDGYPQECRGEKLYRITSAQSPKLIERHEPVYSDGARNSKVKGLVSLRMAVLSSGEVCEPKIIKGLHPEVDAAILAAVRTWRFTPGTYEGTPVAVGRYQPFHIDFSDPDPAALRRAAETQEAQKRAAERKARRNSGAAPGP